MGWGPSGLRKNSLDLRRCNADFAKGGNRLGQGVQVLRRRSLALVDSTFYAKISLQTVTREFVVVEKSRQAVTMPGSAPVASFAPCMPFD